MLSWSSIHAEQLGQKVGGEAIRHNDVHTGSLKPARSRPGGRPLRHIFMEVRDGTGIEEVSPLVLPS